MGKDSFALYKLLKCLSAAETGIGFFKVQVIEEGSLCFESLHSSDLISSQHVSAAHPVHP